ncbi:MAG: thiamine pyrophosphate-dependent dehydrogenase E1 component subunit alpha, partial [Longimicrobiales bacterium]|nr:thiamine pyrophosphate-dependent dehydrogenase E1 component subunit alpha [Longimicrobiales bacterium]
MKRYPPFDPPEYVDWEPDTELVDAFEERLREHEDRAALIEDLDETGRLALYAGMVRTRLHDIMLKRWVRQGVLSKAWLGTGEEAVTVGAVHALDRERDVVAPMIRNAGALPEMAMPLEDVFHGLFATRRSTTGGRDLHFGDLDHGVLQPISHVGDMVPVITGIALAFKQRGEARVALTWVGDGATKTSAFHEGLNLAAVKGVPAVFVIQNNQVALGTRLEQHQAGSFRDWPKMYGVAGASADGNNVLDVWAATRLAANRARSGGGSTLLLMDTFRMGGHATHDEAEARRTFPDELFEHWGRRDPIGLYEEFLVRTGLERDRLEEIERRVTEEIETAAEQVRAEKDELLPP